MSTQPFTLPPRPTKLLGTTRMKVSAIAEECGYRDPDALSHLFRKRFGMSMRDWRRANQPSLQTAIP